ncbi:MAG: sulfatase-like hydrolase/transferase [Verrucomicrobia bacterium]|nr:sulfatase-like hydrolase/transferase [Verrucomicrobiota bacterium]
MYFVSVALLFAVGVDSDADAGAVERPNIVFILCDDLGYGDLGCYGNDIIKTPRLDELASKGMRLTACYAAAPVCSPSRAGIMTGRNPNRSGIRDWIPHNSGIFLHTNEVTVAELVKSAGYRTALIGKWHLSSKMDGTEPRPDDHGFDYWFATQNNAAPSHRNPVNFYRNGEPVGALKGNSTTIIAEESIRFIQENKEAPFMLFVWFHAPHEPIATPEEFKAMYPEFEDTTKPVYYGSVSLIDHEVGRIIDVLDGLGLSNDTLVVFTSDNGPETLNRYAGASRSHGSPGLLRGMKLHMFEGGYRVPGILYWPGTIEAGVECDEPVNGTDFLPTFCELAGVSVPDDVVIDGADVTPVFRGEPVDRETPLFWQYDRAISKPWEVSLRERRWKLLSNEGLDEFLLFNLRDDISETHDLTDEHSDVLDKLVNDMTSIYRSVNE